MKKSLFILLLVMCIGYFIPLGVFARDKNVYSNIFVDYRFSVKDKENYVDNLKFKLYDLTGKLSFESQYDFDSHEYYFYYNHNEYNFYEDLGLDGSARKFKKLNNVTPSNSFSDYVNLGNQIINISNYSDLQNIIDINHLHGICLKDTAYWRNDYICNHYDYIPLVLEEINSTRSTKIKKIVLASLNIYSDFYSSRIDFYNSVVLINHGATPFYMYLDGIYDYDLDEPYYGDVEISFMKNYIVDYDEQLWNSFNDKVIASSELSYDITYDELNTTSVILIKTNDDKAIYSKYQSNVNYRFKVKNGNGMKFSLHDVSNTFNFSSQYDKDSDTYSIVDNSSDSDYQDGIKEFSKIIIDEVKNGKFSELSSKYKSITSDNCSESSCNIYTYIPLVLEGETKDNYAKQIVLGLVDIQYRQENGNDYYDIGLSVYNNTCDLLSSNIDVSQSELINLSRAIEKDYSTSLMNQYSDGSIALADIYDDVDVNTLKDEYCNKLPVISLRQNPKTLNNGVLALIISIFIVIGSSMLIIKKRNVKV